MSPSTKVLGEDVDALFRIFPYLKITERRDGMVRVASKEIPSEVVTPFLRALMRREARLLVEDADAMGDAPTEPRTADQRRADAFVDLIQSISAAMLYQRTNPTDDPGGPEP